MRKFRLVLKDLILSIFVDFLKYCVWGDIRFLIEGFSERNLITAAILVMVNPYQGRVPYLYLRAHKIVLKKPNPTMNRTAVSIVEVTNIK